MKREQVTKTFMMISNWIGLLVYTDIYQGFKGYVHIPAGRKYDLYSMTATSYKSLSQCWLNFGPKSPYVKSEWSTSLSVSLAFTIVSHLFHQPIEALLLKTKWVIKHTYSPISTFTYFKQPVAVARHNWACKKIALWGLSFTRLTHKALN